MNSIIYLSLLLLLGVVHSRECRFANHYTVDQIMNNKTIRDQFVGQYMEGEADFLKLAGLNHEMGLSYDGHQIGVQSGELTLGHPFSASSKESLHWALLLKILEKDSRTAPFGTVDDAFNVLDAKMKSYEGFNKAYPGFGWFLPWYQIVNNTMSPASDWIDRVPSLDNGQLFWAAYSVLYRIKTNYTNAPFNLTGRIQTMIDGMIKYAPTIFYEGKGKVRAVTRMNDMTKPPEQNYYFHEDCKPYCYLDDPYEGELFAVILYLFCDLPSYDQNMIWEVKRKLLQRIEFKVPGRSEVITVQKGWWFSSHEQWKYLYLPYTMSPIHQRLMQNNERARTWNSWARNIPGLYAATNSPLYSDSQNFDYYNSCGIQEIAFEGVAHLDVVTPYGAYPLLLIDQPFGLSWILNMIQGPRGQSILGTIEALNITGAGIAPIGTWDTKITNVVSLLGGTSATNAEALKSLGLLDKFLSIVTSEWERVFTNPWNGENLEYKLPNATIPMNSSPEFDNCKSQTFERVFLE